MSVLGDRARQGTPLMDAETAARMDARLSALYKQDKASLRSRVKQSYLVCDLNGVGRDSLVSMILEAEFGRKRMIEWNAKWR